MCVITIKCDKCSNLKTSILLKIKRNKQILETLNDEDSKIMFKAQNDAFEWVIKRLEKQCNCTPIKTIPLPDTLNNL